MKVVLDIKDNKAEFMMELLGNLPFVKVKPIKEEQKILPMTVEEYRAEVMKGHEDYLAGRYISQEELEKEVRPW